MRTRIIATVGPACADTQTLSHLVEEGVSVFRFNFSHGTWDDHQRLLERIVKVRRRLRKHIAILQDLAGHRIRTGKLAGGHPITLTTGQRFILHRHRVAGTAHGGVSLDYRGPFQSIHRHQMVYIDDGNIHLRVLQAKEQRLITQIEQGGMLGERKGVNIPGVNLQFPVISEKDVEDLQWAVMNNVDFVAQSFVRSAADVLEVKRQLGRNLPHAQVIAKIENREGIKNIAAILRAADGLMVARGDLGISMPIYEIPILQKWLIAACNHFKKPVITATQMLEHMIDHPVPTRAEVTDVANAVIDGTDYVMLSGETAAGRYPVEAGRMMRLVIEHTERHAPHGVRR